MRWDLTKTTKLWHSGAVANFGVLIRDDLETNTGAGRTATYASRESADESLQPKVTVYYGD